MMNVSGKSLLLLLASAMLFTGCEDPQVSVSTLGRKLAAPVLSSSSPFDQDMETQGYVRIVGSCDTRVGPILIGFDEDSFHSPPVSPNISGTSLGSIVNDSDCSDGVFDIFLTSADLLSIWGITTTDDNDDVEQILIKGETWFGDTRTLSIINNRPPGSGNSIATHLALRKVFPSDFAGASQCEMFNAYVLDANGNETSNTTAVSFSVQDSGNAGVTYYQTSSDCASAVFPVSTLSLPAKLGMLTFYARMPASPIDSTIGFTPIVSSGGLQAAPATTVTLRDPASSRRFIALLDAPGTIYKNVCQPITLQRMSYYKTSANETGSLTVTMAPSDSKLEFFTASDCNTGAKTSSILFSSSISTVKTYVKYAHSGTATTAHLKINLNYTVSDSNYDIPSYVVRVDLSSSDTVAKMTFGGPQSISRSQCYAYNITMANSNWAAVPADKDYDVSFASSNTLAGLQFYSDEYCTSPVSTLVVSQGELSKKFYVKSSTGQNASSQITMTPNSLAAVTYNVSVSVNATSYALSMAVTNSPLRDTCSYMMLTYLDSYNMPIPATAPVQLSFFTISAGAAGNVHLYTDPTCSAAYPENTMFTVNPYSPNDYKFYIKVNNAYTDTMLNMNLTTSGALFNPSPFFFYFNLPAP
ncbi:hypothetical protein ACLVWU_02355 [Bdellovibrio sp. HCB290]|uniref:hypothetical protein n=1 Tax=Bdellovibrio sp. HCB290 TaxID=3394356 RepID=UPI0039B39142